MFYVDTMGVNTIKKLRHLYSTVNVQLVLACCSDDVMKTFAMAGGDMKDYCYPSVIDAMYHLDNRMN